jgi:heme/copper-type cytochrome/quinol oxidase subunit 2
MKPEGGTIRRQSKKEKELIMIWKVITVVLVALVTFCFVWSARDMYRRSKCADGASPVKGVSF